MPVLFGEFIPAREHLEQGIALYDPQQHHSLASSMEARPRSDLLIYGPVPCGSLAIQTKP